MYADGRRQTVRVIARLPEQLFELGEQSLHAEKPQLLLRIVDIALPVIHDQICVNEQIYTITTEPQQDLHQLLWFIDGVSIGGNLD